MRIRKRLFERRVKGWLRIEFGKDRLTSYAGLELLRRFTAGSGFLRSLHGVGERLKRGGDVRARAMVLLLIGMFIVGGRRLRHLAYLKGDPMLRRFTGLNRIPDRTTVGRFLKQLKMKDCEELDRLNTEVVGRSIRDLGLRRLTLDMDGTVLSAGMQTERAFRGFNPHHRKNPSYYPISAHIAQTSHIIGHKNRSGDVHDSRGAARFFRRTVRCLREDVGFKGRLEARVDAAFFQRKILESFDSLGVEYAAKVPMVPWLDLKSLIAEQSPKAWRWVDKKREIQGLFMELPIRAWGRTERVAVFRKRVRHKTPKNFQLDLFDPNDGTWEYSVVATNKRVKLATLWHFANGRGGEEKTYAELKSGYAFQTIPTRSYGGNTAWQKLNILAHNLVTSFQIETGATAKIRSRKRTTLFRIQSIRTLRFRWLNKAGRFVLLAGKTILRLPANEATQSAYREIEEALPWAA